MPYQSTSDLPAQTRSLPAGARAVFRSAFNSSFSRYGETRAFRIAWAAVKKVYRKTDGKWVRR